jgi:dUTP pyrophosphatase
MKKNEVIIGKNLHIGKISNDLNLSNVLSVKIKKTHPDAIIPKYAKQGDAAVDLYSVSSHIEKTGEMNYDANIVYDTGLSIEIPVGYVGLIFPRSSVSKYNIWLRNAVGVIDSGYRGNIMLKYGYYNGITDNSYEVGDRIGQLMILPYPTIKFEQVDELSTTDRGIGGFGSTGEK